MSVKPRGVMRNVRKTSLRWFYCFLGKALPSLAHPSAKGSGTLWNPLMPTSSLFYFEIYLVATLICDGISCGFDASLQASTALSSFFAGAYLIIVKVVFFSHLDRRKVRHYYVATGFKSELSADRRYSSESCSSRKKHLREQKSQYSQQSEGEFKSSAFFISKRSIMMRHKRTYSYHLRTKLL